MINNIYSVITNGAVAVSTTNWRMALKVFLEELNQPGIIRRVTFSINELSLCYPMGLPPKGTEGSNFGVHGKNYLVYTDRLRMNVETASRILSRETPVRLELSEILNGDLRKIQIDFHRLDTPAGIGKARLFLWTDSGKYRNLQGYASLDTDLSDSTLIEQITAPCPTP